MVNRTCGGKRTPSSSCLSWLVYDLCLSLAAPTSTSATDLGCSGSGGGGAAAQVSEHSSFGALGGSENNSCSPLVTVGLVSEQTVEGHAPLESLDCLIGLPDCGQ